MASADVLALAAAWLTLRRRRPALADPLTLLAAAGLAADPWQADALTDPAPRLLLNCSRQVGKTTAAAALAVWTALTTAGALVLLLSPSLRQSSEALRRCATLYHALAGQAAPEAESALTLALANGSRLVSLPGSEQTIRGISAVDLLVIDEAARVPDALYYSVRPMLAVSQGRLVALSTPYGRRGWWYEAWAHGGPSWERVTATAEQCPRITAAFLAEERAALPDAWYRQEYEGAFVDSAGAAFTEEQVRGAVDSTLLPLAAGRTLW